MTLLVFAAGFLIGAGVACIGIGFVLVKLANWLSASKHPALSIVRPAFLAPAPAEA
jgi:hypothetical protein